MTRWLLAALAAVLLLPAARAHFIWIVPADDAPTARGAAMVRTTPSASDDTSRTG